MSTLQTSVVKHPSASNNQILFDLSSGHGYSQFGNGTLGDDSSDSLDIFKAVTQVGNADKLELKSLRLSNGTDWNSAGYRITRRVDSISMGYLQFGSNVASSSHAMISLGASASGDYVRLLANGNLGVNVTAPTEKLAVGGNIACDGISFGTAAGNVTSKNLSDYEEGVWTPTLQGHLNVGTNPDNSLNFHTDLLGFYY